MDMILTSSEMVEGFRRFMGFGAVEVFLFAPPSTGMVETFLFLLRRSVKVDDFLPLGVSSGIEESLRLRMTSSGIDDVFRPRESRLVNVEPFLLRWASSGAVDTFRSLAFTILCDMGKWPHIDPLEFPKQYNPK